jgi:hypothetical protein
MAAEADDGHAAAFGAFDRLGCIRCCDSRGGPVGASIALLGEVLIVVEWRRSTHNFAAPVGAGRVWETVTEPLDFRGLGHLPKRLG